MSLKTAKEGTHAYFSKDQSITLIKRPYSALYIESKKTVPVVAYSKKVVRVRCKLYESLHIEADIPRNSVELLVIP